MTRKLLVASVFVATALLLPPAFAGDTTSFDHKEGDPCAMACGHTECYRKLNKMWRCQPMPASGTSCVWHHPSNNGVCTNNLKEGEDMDKNAEKEKENAAKRKAANEKAAADEKAASDKKAADDKKKADDAKKAADAKKSADARKAADDAKKAADAKKKADEQKAKDSKK